MPEYIDMNAYPFDEGDELRVSSGPQSKCFGCGGPSFDDGHGLEFDHEPGCVQSLRASSVPTPEGQTLIDQAKARIAAGEVTPMTEEAFDAAVPSAPTATPPPEPVACSAKRSDDDHCILVAGHSGAHWNGKHVWRGEDLLTPTPSLGLAGSSLGVPQETPDATTTEDYEFIERNARHCQNELDRANIDMEYAKLVHAPSLLRTVIRAAAIVSSLRSRAETAERSEEAARRALTEAAQSYLQRHAADEAELSEARARRSHE